LAIATVAFVTAAFVVVHASVMVKIVSDIKVFF